MAAVYGLTCFQWLTLAVLGVIWRYLGLLGHRMGTTFGHKNVIERNHAPVAQMDRVRASGARGRGFESHRARHFLFLFNDLYEKAFLLDRLLFEQMVGDGRTLAFFFLRLPIQLLT